MMSTSTSMVDPQHLRWCLSHFVTGVAVASYQAQQEVRGITVNSFTSVSLDPPLVLLALARTARAAHHLSRVPFTINVLSEHQADIAHLYAGRTQKPIDVAWQWSDDGPAPTLAGALATFRCRPWQSYNGGDHVLQLGLVVDAEVPVAANRCCSIGDDSPSLRREETPGASSLTSGDHLT